jgi:tetratricopeptide (TPR) repeat protein
MEACLASARDFVDEICIVDTGSTDGTIAIAQRYGARIERREWRNDFAWARNEALAMATRRWILVLDADEIIRPESHEALRTLRTVPASTVGLWVRCYNIVDDYKGTGASSHVISRIFPTSPRVRYRSPIHEFITLDGRDTGLDARKSPIAIDHYGYLKAIVSERRKAERNLEIIRAAVEREPNDPFHWYNLGTTALIEKRVDEGIVALEKMFALIGDQPRGFVPSALAFLADAYTEYRGDAERGVALARESLKRSPRFANAHFTLGRALFALGRYAEAIDAYKAAIDDEPYNREQFLVDDEVCTWKAQSVIGSCYGRLRDPATSLIWFDEGLKNRPGVLPLMINRAKALEAIGRIDDAGRQFHECWETFRDDQTGTDYVNFLLRHNQFAPALAAIERIAPEVSPRCAGLFWITAAAVAERVGRAAQGPDFARRALELAPGAAPVLDAAEKYFTERGDFAGVAALREAELDAPLELAEDYVRRSSRLLAAKQIERAVAVAREGRERFGDHPGLTYDEAAGTVQLGDRARALELLASVTVQDPQTFAKAAFLRSVILGDLGRFAEAIGEIDTVLDIAPGNPDAVLHRVKLLQAAGRGSEAEGTLRTAISSGDRRIAAELAGLLVGSGRFEEAKAIAEAALGRR